MQDKHLHKRLATIENRLHALEQRSGPRENQLEPQSDKLDPKDGADQTQQQSSRVLKTPKEDPRPQQKRERPQFWRIVNRIGVIAAIGYAVVTYLQWRDLKRNFEADERAWISSQGMHLHVPYDQSHLAVTADLINTGKSPVLIDHIEVRIGESSAPFTTTSWFMDLHLSGGSLGPNAVFPLTLGEGDNDIGEEKFNLMQDRKLRHDMWATIWYTDVFGHSHSTDICVTLIGKQNDLGPGNPFQLCPHNSMN